MKAIERIEKFRGLAFARQEPPNWWQALKGEVRQGRSKDVRYLEKTLTAHLDKVMNPEDSAAYRSAALQNRSQYFFSRGGNIDGRYVGIGVEEKCAKLSRDKILDGVLCRGLVWSLGNPQMVEPDEELGATGIFVKMEGPPLKSELASAFFGAVELAREANVHPFFVDGETGEFWPKGAGASAAFPSWLVESPATPLTAPALNSAALDELDLMEWQHPTVPFFGKKNVFTTKETRAGVNVAMAEWSNEWQMIDVGLMLRAMGYAAVKVCYCSKKILKPGGRGVEAKVAKAMRERFGVILDWRVDLEI